MDNNKIDHLILAAKDAYEDEYNDIVAREMWGDTYNILKAYKLIQQNIVSHHPVHLEFIDPLQSLQLQREIYEERVTDLQREATKRVEEHRKALHVAEDVSYGGTD